MACNCGGAGAGSVFQLVAPDGTAKGTFLTRTEAVAALSGAGAGHRVVTTKAKA